MMLRSSALSRTNVSYSRINTLYSLKIDYNTCIYTKIIMYAIDSSMLEDTEYLVYPSLCLSVGDSEVAQPDTISTPSQARAATQE